MTLESRMTPALIRILRAYAECGNIQEAADLVGITVHTAKNELAQAYRILDVDNGPGAWKALGWLTVPGETEDAVLISAMQLRASASALEAATAALVEALHDPAPASPASSSAGSSPCHDPARDPEEAMA